MDDPVSQLASYRLQLGQVEAALTGEPDNAELLALKVDLDEIITITSELVEETNNKVSFEETKKYSKLKKQLNYRVGLTIQAPYEKKMYEAIITELDTSSGTAKVKFANYNTIETVLISQLGEFTGKKTERGR